MGNAQTSTVDDPDGGKADPTRVTTSRRWWILLLVQVSTLSFGIAITATNVVVPQIRGALSLTHDEGAWIVTLFLAAAAVATPLTVHFHCCVIDRVFALGEDGQVHFAEAGALTPEDLGAVQQQVRARVLRWFARAGTLDPADARDMAGWDHGGGFSLDASVRIGSADRAGLQRLLRYCARPPFALERLEQVAAAFINDIGLSSPVYPDQNCPDIQMYCKEQMVAGKPEITALRLAATETYVRALSVPAPESG